MRQIYTRRQINTRVDLLRYVNFTLGKQIMHAYANTCTQWSKTPTEFKA